MVQKRPKSRTKLQTATKEKENEIVTEFPETKY